jgi:hypothetical protein
LGEGVEKNIDICLTKLFSLDNEGNKKKWLSRSLVKDRNKIIVTILWSQNFTQQELGQFNQMLIKEFTLDVVKLALDDVEYGIYKQEYFRDVYTKTAHEETTTIVPLEKDALFGAIITLDAAEDHDVRNPKTMIKLRWTAPEEVKPYTSEQTRIVKLRNDIIVRFSLNQEHELIEGDWTLDIEGIDGTTLFSKTFTVVDSSKEDPALTSEASM